MRIAFITETWLPEIDGVVTRLQHTITELVDRGHEVLVAAPTSGAARPGVVQHRIPGARFVLIDRRRRWALPAPAVARTVRAFGADVVHVVNPVLMGSLAAHSLARRWPLVSSLHTDIAAYAGRYHLQFLRPTLRRLTTMAYSRSEVCLATSRTGVDLIEALGCGPAGVWPPAVDQAFIERRRLVGRRRRVDGEPVNVLCVGRLAREKQYERLRPVLAANPGGPPINVTFVGDGPDRNRLERIFSDTPTSFAGTARGPALIAAYLRADVLAFTSTTDTVGLVLLEAAAVGLPVVAVDSRATRDTLAGYDRLALIASDAPASDWVTALRASSAERTPTTVSWPGPASWQQSTEILLAAYARARACWLLQGSDRRVSRCVGGSAGRYPESS